MFAWFAGPVWAVVGLSPNLYLQDQRESREVILGATLTLLVFGALFGWGLFKG
jgi:hypothetical protein